MLGLLTRRKSMDDILDDAAFWNEQRAIMFKAIRPVFEAAFVAGAMAAKLEVAVAVKALDDAPPPGFDLDAINLAADQFIDTYTNDWWQKVERSTQDRLRDTIKTATAEGKSVRWVSEQIVDLFGPERAKGIAVTEMTNLMGAGAQAQYKLDGYTQWEWRTSNDDRVCPVCGPRNEQAYGITEQFSAAHPGCRCWPVPAGDRAVVEEPNPTGPLTVEEQATALARLEQLPTSPYAGASTPTLGISLKDVGFKPGDIQVYGEPSKMQFTIEAVVPLNQLGRGQAKVPLEGARAYITNPSPGLPMVARDPSGNLHVVAGHTRLTALALGGRTEMKVIVFDVAEGRDGYYRQVMKNPKQ